MPSKPVSIILALVLFAAAAVACGPLPDDERDGPQSTRSAQSLTSISINPINPNLPKLSLPTTDVMTWNAWGTGRGAHWRLSDYGVVRVRTALTHPRGWNLVGVAGDRVLWASGSGGAELWTIDSNNQRVATHTLPSPGSGYSAVGLAQASPLAWNCYRTGAEQNYYVAWDAIPDAESREGRWAVQLVAGDGYVRRTNFQNKPFGGLTALWFGYAADGYEAMLFRNNTGAAYLYRAVFSGTTYTLQNLKTFQRSGYQVVGMTAKKRPTSLTFNPLGGTPFNNHLLFSSYSQSSGAAILAAYDAGGIHLADWSYSSPTYSATGYAYVPPVCR